MHTANDPAGTSASLITYSSSSSGAAVSETLRLVPRSREKGLWENAADNIPRAGRLARARASGRRCEESFRLIARCRRLAKHAGGPAGGAVACVCRPHYRTDTHTSATRHHSSTIVRL